MTEEEQQLDCESSKPAIYVSKSFLASNSFFRILRWKMKNVVAAVGTCLAFLALFSLLGRSTSNEPVANNASMVEMNSPLHNRSTGSTTKREKRDAGVWDECASSTSVELFKDCAKAYHAERKEEAAFLSLIHI